MKRNLVMKISIGLLAAIITIGATRAVMRAKAEQAETRKAQLAAEAVEAKSRKAEAERR